MPTAEGDSSFRMRTVDGDSSSRMPMVGAGSSFPTLTAGAGSSFRTLTAGAGSSFPSLTAGDTRRALDSRQPAVEPATVAKVTGADDFGPRGVVVCTAYGIRPPAAPEGIPR